MAYNQLGDREIIEVAAKTISGPFRFETERYISKAMADNDITREQVSLQGLRDHLEAKFLNVDEAAALQDEVENLKQSTYEPTAQYSRRFREVADSAYPTAQCNPDQEQLLIKAYARGLTSNELARKLVEEVSQHELESAIAAIARFSERKDAYDRLGRTVVPMAAPSLNIFKNKLDNDAIFEPLMYDD